MGMTVFAYSILMSNQQTDTPLLNDQPTIQDTLDGQQKEAQNQCMTSCLNLSPAAIPPVLLDAIHFPVNLRGPRHSTVWPKIMLPKALKEAFQTKHLSVKPDGGLIPSTNTKVLRVSGACVHRIENQLPKPLKGSELKNQLTDQEMLTIKANPACNWAEDQFESVIKVWCSLHSLVENGTVRMVEPIMQGRPHLFIEPPKWNRFEVYREYQFVGDEDEHHERLKQVLGSIFGEYEVIKERKGKRKDNGNELVYILTLPQAIQATDGAKVGLKLYRKGNRHRVEVMFLNVVVPGFNANSSYPSVQKACELMRMFAKTLIHEGTCILDLLHQHLFTGRNNLDLGLLRTKLSKDLRFKSVESSKSFDHLMTDLLLFGNYTPSQHPKSLRIEGERMAKLCDPTFGILERVPNQKYRKSLRLKANWENSPAVPSGFLKSKISKQVEEIEMSNTTLEVRAYFLGKGYDLNNLPDEGVLLKSLKSHTGSGE